MCFMVMEAGKSKSMVLVSSKVLCVTLCVLEDSKVKENQSERVIEDWTYFYKSPLSGKVTHSCGNNCGGLNKNDKQPPLPPWVHNIWML